MNGPFSKRQECTHCLNYNGVATGRSGLHDFDVEKTPNNSNSYCVYCGDMSVQPYRDGYWLKGKCRVCGDTYQTFFCEAHGSRSLAEAAAYYEKYCRCSWCNGNRYETFATTCKHGEWDTHTYCSHGHTSQHDTD